MNGPLLLAIAVFAALPLIVFRARLLAHYLASEVAGYVLAAFFWRLAPTIDPWFAIVAFGVAKLSVFGVFLVRGAERDIRWSAWRAALIAALLYAAVIPAVTRVPIDGDEPFYLLITESLARDGDLDLANQYRDLSSSATRRLDLRPQFGDTTGPKGEHYSRLEPFLPLLIAPGYAVAGLPGVLATIALFGVLLARSFVRALEDEGLPAPVVRAMFLLVAAGPPVLYYATRIWVEVPAAFLFLEAVRGARARRAQRWAPALFFLVLLKLRFALLAAPLLLLIFIAERRMRPGPRQVAIAAALLATPLLFLWIITGSPTASHTLRELLPVGGEWYVNGFFGLFLDGAAGLLFQAPVFMLGVFAIARWRDTPLAFRIGCLASTLYVAYLVPRAEWHGGWAPPLRYVVVVMPVLGIGAAWLWGRVPHALRTSIVIWTAALVIHGVAWPWRLFHIANGENVAGEFLSTRYHADFSRLFPSLIRPNTAAIVGAVVLAVSFALFAIRRFKLPDGLIAPLFSLLIALSFVVALRPGRVVHFEDAHVIRRGGELYPELYTVGRFQYRGGWIAHAGDSFSFRARGGRSVLHYRAPASVTIELGGHAHYLPATGDRYGAADVEIAKHGRVELRVLSGVANFDRLETRD